VDQQKITVSKQHISPLFGEEILIQIDLNNKNDLKKEKKDYSDQ
jgi:hypothetical protein